MTTEDDLRSQREAALTAEVDPIFGLPLLPPVPPDTSGWVTDLDEAHALAIAEHEYRCAEELYDLARSETQAAADWPDHAFDWSEPD